MTQIPGLELFPEAGETGTPPLTSVPGIPATSVFIKLSFPCPSYLQEEQCLLFCPLSSCTGCSFALQGKHRQVRERSL